MRIDTYSNGKYRILRVHEKNHTISELEELRDLIKGNLERGRVFIAVSFSDASYIYSDAINVLVQCHNLVLQKGGDLCIIEPDPKLFDVLEKLNIDRVIHVFVSEEFLPA